MDTFENTPQEGFEPKLPEESNIPESSPVPHAEAPSFEAPASEPPAPEAVPTFTGNANYRQASPTAYTPYTEPVYQAPVYKTYTVPAAAPAPAPKPKKKRRFLGLIIPLACITLLLVGAVVGGAVAGFVLNNRYEETTDHLQSQIDAFADSGQRPVIQSTPTPITPPADGEMYTPAQVYEMNVASVVSVTTTIPYNNGWTSGTSKGAGSGFILTADGYILTNYHVIEGASQVHVATVDREEYEATVVGYDEFSDVALLKVEAQGLPYVTAGDSDVLRVGDMVAAIGNPLGELASTQTVGYVSAKNRMVNTDGTTLNMIQTDAAINSGNSGGPLFNMYGQVIGITTAKYSGSSSSGATIEGIGFAIPINTVMVLVDDLMEHGYVTGQAYLGITLRDMDPEVAASYGLPAGPKVETVTEGSCSDKAGLKPGDIITGLGEQTVESYADLRYALRNYRVGDTTQIHIFRAGQELSLTVTFDEKPLDTAEPQATEPQQEDSNTGGFNFGYGWPFFPFP